MKASDNAYPSILIEEGTEPTAPAAGHQRLYINSTSHALMVVNSGGSEPAVGGGGGITSGTSNPGSPANGDFFYRSDLDLLIRYRSSGTRWVTTTLYRDPLQVGDAAQPHTANTSIRRHGTPNIGGFDLWVESIDATTIVLTTNNGSNYWTLNVAKQTPTLTPTSIATFNTSADTSSTWTAHNTSVAAVLAPSTHPGIVVDAAKTLSPGSLYTSFVMTYRYIVT